jgi:hypothetical protein
MWRPCNNGHVYVYSGLVNIFRTHHQSSTPMDKDRLKINISNMPIRSVKVCSLVLTEVSNQ